MCPDAWLLNYTNPMAMNVTFLHHVAPRLKVLGLCHSVYWTMVGLCELVDVPYDEVSYWSAGVNHQAWVLRWERGGENLYPLLDQRIAADPELRRRVRVDMYRRLGYYPTETSEHSSEYVPWYLHHPDEIDRLRINVGEYVSISEANLAEYRRVRAELADTESLPIDTGSTEYAPQVIHSLETGTPRVISANVVNDGLITNLPDGVAVEVPTMLDALGAHPMKVGDLPPQCAALNRSFLGPVDLAVRAAVDGDPRLVRAAAMVDPNTAATLTVDQIWELCDELTTAHGDLLPDAALCVPPARPPRCRQLRSVHRDSTPALHRIGRRPRLRPRRVRWRRHRRHPAPPRSRCGTATRTPRATSSRALSPSTTRTIPM